MQNRHIILKQRPDGLPRLTDFALEASPIRALEEGEFLVANSFIGLQPAARIRMGTGDSYAAPTPLGTPPYGQTVGRVVQSRHPGFAEGDHVALEGAWESHTISNGEKAWVFDPQIAPESYWLGCLGVSGMTGYVGVKEILKAQAGETIVISAATGAVGHVAGQIAKAMGCRVIGVAGGAEKCAAAVSEFGYDICVDHRDPSFAERLAEACPDGIDLDFENVGGPVRDAIWRLMNPFGRIAICGLISEYNAEGAIGGPSWQLALARRLTVRGFLLRDHLELRPSFIAEVSALLAKGAFRTRETITDGIENAPSAFIDMLQGRNFGKALVRV
ncbi:NADP-dependent oxidoreductase [Seohaeicola nanhaiensis]|uniref:NADP-dependent oxidoreductase n=1 Tax=Seohaeicola nanhaiensis TaxID=1387282 RepID=A0ABV9KN10_9RHOB